MIISKLDYARLRERVQRAKNHAATTGSASKVLSDKIFSKANEAKIVGSVEIPPDVVTMNSIVRIRYLTTQATMDFRIVYPELADITQNRISIFAPMATALLGGRIGEFFWLTLPDGTAQIQLETILYQPEAAGDLHL